MANTDPIWQELADYISTTRSGLNKMVEELERKQTLDVERLETYIRYQKQACLSLQSAIDELLGRSKNG